VGIVKFEEAFRGFFFNAKNVEILILREYNVFWNRNIIPYQGLL